MIGTTGSKSRRQRWLVFGVALVALFLATAVVARLPAAEPATASNPDNSVETPDTAGDTGVDTSIALDGTGRPVIAYYDRTNDDLKVLHCGDANCATGNTITSPDTAGSVGEDPSLALDAAGNPVIGYFDASNADLKVLHCGDPNCTTGNVITSPDSTGSVGRTPSLVLDASGHPVIAYREGLSTSNLKILHCGDANCATGNTITSPDTGGGTPSIALDSSGFPVVSYRVTGVGLKVLHCGDANCATGNTVSVADSASGAGEDSSIALDGSGNPIVSYRQFGGGTTGIKVLSCGDANCASGNSISLIDTGSVHATSLKLDLAGLPVVSYALWNGTDGDLNLLHCGNADCSSGNSITIPDAKLSVGWHSSLVLDASGNPVVSYNDDTNRDLKVLHCDDPDCVVTKPASTWTPSNTPTDTATPTPPNTPGPNASPTATPFNSTDTAMLLSVPSHNTCNDPNQPTICYVAAGTTFTVSVDLLNPPAIGYVLAQVFIDYDTNGLVHKKNTQVTWPDCDLTTLLKGQDVANEHATVGCLTDLFAQTASFYSGSIYTFELTCTNSHTRSTISLLPTGDPEAGTSGALLVNFGGGKTVPKVGDLTIECVGLPEPGDTDGDGCSDAKEFGLDEALGGRRDYVNPWDFYDVAGFNGGPPDSIIDLPNDILGVIQHFAPQGQPPYDVAFDRGHRDGETLWSMTAPDGVIDLPIDILGVILQFGHNCQ